MSDKEDISSRNDRSSQIRKELAQLYNEQTELQKRCSGEAHGNRDCRIREEASAYSRIVRRTGRVEKSGIAPLKVKLTKHGAFGVRSPPRQTILAHA